MRTARSFSFRLPSCATPSETSGAWDLCGPAGFPTPRVYSRASVLGLWGAGDRVPSFPDHRRRGKAVRYPHHPRPHFRNRQPEHRSPDLSGSPNVTPGVPPGYVWIGIGRPLLSDRTPR